MSKWDKGVDYENMYQKILRNMKRNTCYNAILLIQLRNGLRIGEACQVFKDFLRTKKIELETKVLKKKREEKRLVIIPKELLDLDLSKCYDLLEIDNKKLRERVREYCLRTYKINTHSLRYAFITYLLKQGVNPSIIAKITKHSKLDFILAYTQEKEAKEVLRGVQS